MAISFHSLSTVWTREELIEGEGGLKGAARGECHPRNGGIAQRPKGGGNLLLLSERPLAFILPPANRIATLAKKGSELFSAAAWWGRGRTVLAATPYPARQRAGCSK